jgi:hypothetical protein
MGDAKANHHDGDKNQNRLKKCAHVGSPLKHGEIRDAAGSSRMAARRSRPIGRRRTTVVRCSEFTHEKLGDSRARTARPSVAAAAGS